MISVLGSLFLLVYGSTAILPNFAIAETVLFYSTNIIPLIASDYILSRRSSRFAPYLAAAILGSTFYMFYYPYIMYTYNEFLLGRLVSPSMIYTVYFEMIHQVFLITIIPAILSALAGIYFSKKICKRIESFN